MEMANNKDDRRAPNVQNGKYQNDNKYNMCARRDFEDSRATGLNISRSLTIQLISGVRDSSRTNRQSKFAMLRIHQNRKGLLLQNHIKKHHRKTISQLPHHNESTI